jgi:uncharacterized protein (TIGR03437 family)
MGLGPVDPAVPTGRIAAQASIMQMLPQVFIGGLPAAVTYAGLVAGTVGLYQINVVIPDVTMPAGQTFNDAIDVHLVVNGVQVPVPPPGGVSFTLSVAQQ